MVYSKYMIYFTHFTNVPQIFLLQYFLKKQNQPSVGVLRKKFPENIQEIYRTASMLKCDLSKVVLQRY